MNVTIHDVMVDQALLGSRFGSTWAAWEIVAKAIDALPLTDDQASIWREHTGRSAPPSGPCRELWLVCGRRSGKSRFAALLAVCAAAFKEYHLAPGERGVVMLIAADRKQARVLKSYVLGLLEAPILAGMVEKVTKETIVLTNGIDIEIHTCSFRTVRGYSVVCAVCDEVAYWSSDELGANPDSEVIAALRPALASAGGLLVALSSPYARRGELWRAHEKHFSQDEDPVIVWQSDTRTMNPTIPTHVIEDAYTDDPSVAAAEWGGEFRRDVESFASRESVEAAIETGCFERGHVQGRVYHAFVDPAGGSGKDSMTLAISHLEGNITVLDLLREQRPPFSPEACTKSFAETMKSYGLHRGQGDAYAGSWPTEAFAKVGIVYRPSAEAKSRIYERLLPALNSGRIRLLDHPRLKAQLLALERRTSRGAKDSIDHPPGQHDDVVNAAAGALVLASAGPGIVTVAPQGGHKPNPFGRSNRRLPHPFHALRPEAPTIPYFGRKVK
jgi:hypothetical protein